MNPFNTKQANSIANPVAPNPNQFFSSEAEARRVLADGISSPARKTAAYSYLQNNTKSVTKTADTNWTPDGNTGGNTGGNEGGGSVVASAAPAQPSKADQLRGQSYSTLDELLALYDQIVGQIKTASGEQATRINGSYDQKVTDQGTAMNEGMYSVDANAAASNLADSSFRSTDRSKVRTAAEKNIGILNEGRKTDLTELGKVTDTDVAKYTADKSGIDLTRQLLADTTDESELSKTVASLGSTKRGVEADQAKYKTGGAYLDSVSKLGKYDTTQLEETLQSVVNNSSATPEAKNSTINDIIDGTTITDADKSKLRTKYNQIIG